MGFFTKIFGGADGIREAMRDSYDKHVRLAQGQGVQSDSLTAVGLFGALGSRYRVRGRSFSEVGLWAELAPFLLMPQAQAVSMLAEYAVYQEMPHDVRGTELSSALSRALEAPIDDDKARVAAIGFMQHVPWSHLISSAAAANLRRIASELPET